MQHLVPDFADMSVNTPILFGHWTWQEAAEGGLGSQGTMQWTAAFLGR